MDDKPLTPEQKDAFREYVKGLDEQCDEILKKEWL